MSHSNPEVSVILPVYNSERYLRQAVDSIINQTLRDFELIIINDGSTDQSGSILHEYTKYDDRIRLIERENRGLTKSLNEGIQLSRGNWIARMDADDISHPQRLQLQLKKLIENKADIVGSSLQFIDSPIKLKWHFPLSHESCLLRMAFRSPFAHPAVIMKASIARNLRYDESVSYGQDYELWTRSAIYGAKMMNCKLPLLFYRRHPEQISCKKTLEQRIAFESTRKKYCDWLGINSDRFAVTQKFSGGGYQAQYKDIDELADLLAGLSQFSGQTLTKEFNIRLLDVDSSNPMLLIQSIKFAKRINARYSLNSRLIFQSLCGISNRGLLTRFFK